MQLPGKTRDGAMIRGMSRLRTFLLGSTCCFFLLLMIFAPAGGLDGARTGLTLCGEVIVPSLFPFLALSVFVIRTGLAQRFGRLFEHPMQILFRLPGSAAAALALGIVGGYPVGAKACADLCGRGALSREEAERLLAFCVNSSPAFIIGAVGTGMLHSSGAGLLLYSAHLGASLLTGVLFSAFAPHARAPHPSASPKGSPASKALVAAVTGAAASIIHICAFVVLFSAITGLIFESGLLPGNGFLAGAAFRTALKGLLEVTNGCAAAAPAGGVPALLILSAMLSWSGLSVVCQIISCVGDTGLSVRAYLLARIPHAVFSLLMTLLLLHFFPQAVPVFAGNRTVVIAGVHSAPGSAALLILCAMLLLSQLAV